MKAILTWLGAVLLAGFITTTASAQQYYPSQAPPPYACGPGGNCGSGYGAPCWPAPTFCPNGPPVSGVPPYSVPVPKHWWSNLFHHCPQPPGLASFATHPYARSPRDFYMVDVNP